MRNETATMAAVAPSAMPSCRHSRRTTNHSRPTPQVGLVSSTNDHVQGCRKPEHDGRPDEQVHVAVVQLHDHRREGQHDERPSSTEPDGGGQQHGQPDPQEHPPLETAREVEQHRHGRAVRERTQAAHRDLVRVRQLDAPVGPRVEPDRPDAGCRDDEGVDEERETADDQPVQRGATRDRPSMGAGCRDGAQAWRSQMAG